ncbi:MAG: hypothetical protein ACPGLV_04230 [Bacteroidia bacterium]
MFNSIKLWLPLAIIICTGTNTTNISWKLSYNKNDIKVYTRTTSSGLSEFKGVTTINAPLEQVAALLDNVKNQTEFVYGVKESYVVKEITPAQKVIYSEVEMPWPLDNRDIVSKLNARYDNTQKIAFIETKADPDYIPKKSNLVRMETAEGFWKLQFSGQNSTDITYQFVSDPGGLPNWVVSLFVVDAPKETLLELKKLEPQLQKATKNVSWID